MADECYPAFDTDDYDTRSCIKSGVEPPNKCPDTIGYNSLEECNDNCLLGACCDEEKLIPKEGGCWGDPPPPDDEVWKNGPCCKITTKNGCDKVWQGAGTLCNVIVFEDGSKSNGQCLGTAPRVWCSGNECQGGPPDAIIPPEATVPWICDCIAANGYNPCCDINTHQGCGDCDCCTGGDNPLCKPPVIEAGGFNWCGIDANPNGQIADNINGCDITATLVITKVCLNDGNRTFNINATVTAAAIFNGQVCNKVWVGSAPANCASGNVNIIFANNNAACGLPCGNCFDDPPNVSVNIN